MEKTITNRLKQFFAGRKPRNGDEDGDGESGTVLEMLFRARIPLGGKGKNQPPTWVQVIIALLTFILSLGVILEFAKGLKEVLDK